MGERLNKSSIMMASELPQRIRQRKHVSASFGVNGTSGFETGARSSRFRNTFRCPHDTTSAPSPLIGSLGNPTPPRRPSFLYLLSYLQNLYPSLKSGIGNYWTRTRSWAPWISALPSTSIYDSAIAELHLEVTLRPCLWCRTSPGRGAPCSHPHRRAPVEVIE